MRMMRRKKQNSTSSMAYCCAYCGRNKNLLHRRPAAGDGPAGGGGGVRKLRKSQLVEHWEEGRKMEWEAEEKVGGRRKGKQGWEGGEKKFNRISSSSLLDSTLSRQVL